jgi:methionyl-tRNA formyltransferase
VSTPAPSVYLGTSDFAATVLRILAATPHRPSLVVTPPDRKRGRGRKLGSPPAAEAARELGIELHQTADVNDADSVAAIAATGAEVACVCAFGQIIREGLLTALPMLNVHPSLLPRWRGAAPIERAIMAGDEATGVCVMRLTSGLDSGPVALREEVPIGEEEYFGSLAARLAERGGALLAEALARHGDGSLAFEEQAEDGVTYAEKLDSAERRLDPRRAAAEEVRRVRALTPHIGAYAEVDGGERIGLRGCRAVDADLAPGAFAAAGHDLLLGCSPGAFVVAELQPPGGRWMEAAEYMRGRGLPAPAMPPPA